MSLKKQAGMTALGWLIVLAIIGFFILLAVRLTPMYMESFNVAGALESLQNEPYITDKTPHEIQTLLTKRLYINNVENVKADQADIKKEGGVITISLKYELRRHIMGNVDVVASFHEEVEIVDR